MRGGFSLVEVAIATTVMASAALLLSASLATSNAQKAASRRQGLAKSLAVRQLELIQQRINESQISRNNIDMSQIQNRLYQLVNLRGGNHNYSFLHTPGQAAFGNHFYCYSSTPQSLSSGGNAATVMDGSPGQAPASELHVLRVSTGPNPLVAVPPGSMLPAERQRITDERLDVLLQVSAVNAAGHDDPRFPQAPNPLPQQLVGNIGGEGGLELLLFQVTVLDKFDNPAGVPMVTLSRMYRVQAKFFFPIEGQF